MFHTKKMLKDTDYNDIEAIARPRT